MPTYVTIAIERTDYMKKLVSLLLIMTLMLSASSAFAFSDIPSGHWASEYINDLSQSGVINGYEDGTFRPDGDVTRAEFAKLLSLSFELDSSSDGYSDIADHWAKEYILQSSSVVYAPSDDYSPDAKATRAELAYALANVLALESEQTNAEFADWDSVPEAMAQKVSAAVENGIIEGYEDGTIRGGASVTRAEACALIVRAIKFALKDNENADTTPPEDTKDPSAGEDTDTTTDHIYTLYPMKDILTINEVTTIADSETGGKAYKLTYAICGGEGEEYSAVISEDAETVVMGTKSSLASLAKGDVIVFDTAFYGYIDTIWVLASFDSAVPTVSIPESMKYGTSDDYMFVAGTVTAVDRNSKSVGLSLQSGSDTIDVTVPFSASLTLYSDKGRASWIEDSVGYIDEGMFVFVRYTDSRVTEVIAAE